MHLSFSRKLGTYTIWMWLVEIRKVQHKNVMHPLCVLSDWLTSFFLILKKDLCYRCSLLNECHKNPLFSVTDITFFFSTTWYDMICLHCTLYLDLDLCIDLFLFFIHKQQRMVIPFLLQILIATTVYRSYYN